MARSDGCSEGNSGEEDGGAAVTAGDAAPILVAPELDLDAVAAALAALVMPDGLIARSAAWDARVDAFGLERAPEPVRVVAAVAEQPPCLWHAAQQGRSTGVVAA